MEEEDYERSLYIDFISIIAYGLLTKSYVLELHLIRINYKRDELNLLAFGYDSRNKKLWIDIFFYSWIKQFLTNNKKQQTWK